jgi:RES domain-containing protein
VKGAVTVWRIATDTPDYEADDMSGKGAEATGGRWNRKGTPMVYASLSRSLACLETVVHLSGGYPLPLNRFLIQIRIPIALWKARREFVQTQHLGWDSEPAGKVSLDWGTAWAYEKATLIAEVPSVIVPEEHNVLINPLHRDASKLTSVKIRRWTYDHRIKQTLP